MLEAIVGIFTSAAGGGLVGLIGTAIKQYQERKEREADRQFQLQMRDKDLAEMKEEAALRLKQTETEIAGQKSIAQTEADAARDVANAATQRASYEHDEAKYATGSWIGNVLRGFWGGLAAFMMVFVDFARGMIRPTTTIYLLAIESYIAWLLYQLLQALGGLGLLTPDQVFSLFREVVLSIVFLSATALTWWYGASPNRQTK